MKLTLVSLAILSLSQAASAGIPQMPLPQPTCEKQAILAAESAFQEEEGGSDLDISIQESVELASNEDSNQHLSYGVTLLHHSGATASYTVTMVHAGCTVSEIRKN